MGPSQREIDEVIGRNGNGSLSVKAIVGAAITAIVLGFGSYVAGGAGRADDVRTQLEVFKAEVNGRLQLIQERQERVQQDISEIKAVVKAK